MSPTRHVLLLLPVLWAAGCNSTPITLQIARVDDGDAVAWVRSGRDVLVVFLDDAPDASLVAPFLAIPEVGTLAGVVYLRPPRARADLPPAPTLTPPGAGSPGETSPPGEGALAWATGLHDVTCVARGASDGLVLELDCDGTRVALLPTGTLSIADDVDLRIAARIEAGNLEVTPDGDAVAAWGLAPLPPPGSRSIWRLAPGDPQRIATVPIGGRPRAADPSPDAAEPDAAEPDAAEPDAGGSTP